jgi:hypothetical protein
LQGSLFAQDFVVNNPVMTPNPGVFPGGVETVTFDFYVAGSSFAFSNDELSNNYGTITFSFTKLNPTGITPSGTGAALFNWVLTNNGGTGAGRTYTYTGTTKTVVMNQSPPAAKYKITFTNVPITLAATQAESDVRVAGQFTDPGNAAANSSGNNNASIATYTAPSGGPLPISLIDFTATKQTKVVDLNWQTSTEQNSRYFDVEFSRDGSKFESIGKADAAGSSSSLKYYFLVHLTPVNGANYYRLKMVDVDGSFRYSAVRIVKFSSIKSITVMPNPTVNRVYITSNEGGILQSVGVYSINGKLLQQVTNFALGKSIDLSTYAPSIYILKMMDKDGSTEIIKVIRK